ncbi:MAG TPA: glycosyltransferase family 4 protein [Candidatus Bipolaricaulis sp.]|nr:glycosyltransferase family 4 protein [Candidatus Bipolaricaulis sp.]MDY0392747.1 glycosyltransferase family 4 protein [Candidatus Bipolaricaulis sp.]HPD06609.1 glycosyltransferase family 4 protein [Candidatus Bipolaricaulis sp.]HRS13705.1 glycosyltransferase family 4 protein [Candidatus Bipolaricaulis sp.]HRU21587.1 glycosyltransferase family 4 protein [Candidatus Bipolaricaulis sp.]
MKIGIFTDTYTPDSNGVVTVVRLMERELRQGGHEVRVFAPAHPEAREKREDLYRFRSVRFILYKGLRVALPYNRRAFAALRDLDIVHSHDPFSVGLVGFWASLRYGIPHVHTYHTRYVEYRKYVPYPFRPSRQAVERLSRMFCNRCDAVIAPSSHIERELRQYGVKVPIHILPFGVDEEAYTHPPMWDVRQALGLPPSSEILLYVGRLGWEKNIEFLIRAFRRIARERSGAWLVIIGDGPHRPKLEGLVRELGLTERVVFVGHLPWERLIDPYRQATLFVFASKTETQGLVVMEAMMGGTPPVAVDAMGVADLIVSGETGLLVREDEGAFADACLSLLADEAWRKEMGERARRWAVAHSARASVARLMEIYEGLRRERSGRHTCAQAAGPIA